MTSYSSTTSSRHPYSPRLASPLRTVLLPLKSPSRIASATSTQPPLSAGLLERLSELRGLESKTPRQMDIRLARRLMQLHRTASGRDKWYRHPNFKDANSVLDNISRGLVPGTPALVLALITQFHASVSIARPRSTNILKSMRDRDQTELKSRILAQAAENCTDEIMYILALYADATAVSEALPVAIVQRQSLKVMILMAKGADASGLCELFLQTVESGPEDLVDALLEDSDRGACQNCRNLGMVRAAMFRQKSKAALLLRRGADVSFDNASALFAACRRGMQPLAIHMVFSAVGSRRLDARLLDQLAGESYALRQYRLLEACLQMGARGHATDRALIKAVLDRQSSLVGLLARHGADLSHDGGSPVQLAVQSQRPQLLATLLRDGHATLRRGIIGAAVSEAMKFSEHQMAKEMTELLLKANIHRDSVNEALILVLSIDGSSETLGNDQSRAALAHLLITKGQADLNVNGGVCLGMALNNGWLETVRQLLHPRAPFEALSNALRDVMTLQNPQLRLSLLACLTEHIELSQEADADVKEILMSTALQAAAGALLPDVVQFLISSCRRFSEAHLSAAWESATSPDQDGRWLSPDGLGVLHILLEQGVSDEHIANSFCVAVTKCHREAMRLLFFCVKTEATFSKALHSLAESQAPPFWCLEDNLWLVGDLLASGCDGLSVNKALLVAVEACAQGIGSETVVEAILTDSGRADINFQDGEALKLAIGAGRISLLNLLLSGGNAQRTVLTQAFASLITTCLDETTMVHLLDALQGDECEDDEPKFDINITLSRGLPSLAACLNVNPGHAELVRRLIELGCHTEAEFQFDLYREDGPGEEPTTVLLWACQSLGEGAVSAAVIETLIAGKGNVNSFAHYVASLVRDQGN